MTYITSKNCDFSNESFLDNKYNDFNWNYKNILSQNKPYFVKNNITVGIIDSGIDATHPFLINKDITGKSYIDESQGLSDEFGHGTQVIGVLDNLVRNIKIKSYKFLEESKSSSLNLLKAIMDAVDDEVDIINISSGLYKDFRKEKDAFIINYYQQVIDYAVNQGIIIVASSGNDGINLNDVPQTHIPSEQNGVISVSSTNKDGSISSYSNLGKCNILAPGGEFSPSSKNKIDIKKMILTYRSKKSKFINMTSDYSSIPNFISFSYGTSIAVPQVTAAVIIEMDKNPFQTPNYYFNKILKNSQKTHFNNIECYKLYISL